MFLKKIRNKCISLRWIIKNWKEKKSTKYLNSNGLLKKKKEKNLLKNLINFIVFFPEQMFIDIATFDPCISILLI